MNATNKNPLTKKLLTKKLLCVGCALTLAAAGLAAAFAGGAPAHDAKVAAPATAESRPLDPASPEVQQAVDAAKGLSTAFRVVSERLLPSVVAIETAPKQLARDATRPPSLNLPGGQNPFEGTPFEDFFRGLPNGQGFRFESPREPRGRAGLGSGVVIDASGLVMTNNHVVRGGGEITVRLHDGREFKSVEVWTDPKTDIAIVKIDAPNLIAAPLGDSDATAIGDWVLALGQPFGLESTVTAGIISAKQRGIGIADRESFLQTDAAINPGNSGGPLVNLDGEVIGINTAISSRSGGSEGIGFAVPINLAKWVGNQLARGGVVRRAYLGVGIQPVTAALAEQFQVQPREGVVVTQVFPDTPAAQAGLQEGDVIVALGGAKVSSPQALQLLVERAELGQSKELSVIRDGKQVTLALTPREQPEEFGVSSGPAKSASPEASSDNSLGVEIRSLDAAVAEQLGMPDAAGVVVTNVKPGSPAERAGLSSGDVITQVNRQAVHSAKEFTAAIDGSRNKSLLLLVRGENGSRFVVVTP